MASGFKGAVGALVVGSLLLSSTGAAAAASSAPAAPISATQIDPWTALSALSGQASSQGLCGAAAQTARGCMLAQADTPPPAPQTGPPPQPIPVPPIEAPGGFGLGVDPLLLVLGVIAVGALLYFVVIKKKNNNSNSPA